LSGKAGRNRTQYQRSTHGNAHWSKLIHLQSPCSIC
jgi:hypothetical protein